MSVCVMVIAFGVRRKCLSSSETWFDTARSHLVAFQSLPRLGTAVSL